MRAGTSQERDSPASLPMVLCVSQVRWGDPPDEADNGSLVIVGLELTDGWYRIRTNVDETLRRACERGKLVVGSKISVSGAKVRPLLVALLSLPSCTRPDEVHLQLDSATTDGVEVLQGLHSSTVSTFPLPLALPSAAETPDAFPSCSSSSRVTRRRSRPGTPRSASAASRSSPA